MAINHRVLITIDSLIKNFTDAARDLITLIKLIIYGNSNIFSKILSNQYLLRKSFKLSN